MVGSEGLGEEKLELGRGKPGGYKWPVCRVTHGAVTILTKSLGHVETGSLNLLL